MNRNSYKSGLTITAVFIAALALYVFMSRWIPGFLVISIYLMVALLCYIFYMKRLERFQYIYKITDYDQQIKELNAYIEKGGKPDYLYYNTVSIIQLRGLAFAEADAANELMLAQTKGPNLSSQLIYENNKCLLLCYLKKYRELAELIEPFQAHINKSRRKQRNRYYTDTLLSARIQLAVADKDICRAKELLAEYTRLSPTPQAQNYSLMLHQAQICDLEGNAEAAGVIADRIINNCKYRPLVYQAQQLIKGEPSGNEYLRD